jgi:hypothetical protein
MPLQIFVLNSADACGERFPGVEWWSVNAPHLVEVLVVGNIALCNPNTYEGPPL